MFGREEDTFTAVPSHLYYMMREVLKNSCRATVEHGRRTRPGKKLPPVKVRANGIPFLGCRNPLARFSWGDGGVINSLVHSFNRS